MKAIWPISRGRREGAGPLSASSYYRLAGLFQVSANSTASSAALMASGLSDWKIHSRAGTLIGGRPRVRVFSIDRE